MYPIQISNIPSRVVNDHNEALYYWAASLLKSATLLHIDAHPDMRDGTLFEKTFTESSYKNFSISQFICPAVYHGILTSVYWLNPHSKSEWLQDLGTTKDEEGREKLEAILVRTFIFFSERKYTWSAAGFVNPRKIREGHGKVISPEELRVRSPFILDVDLDAFCCNLNIRNVPLIYDGVSNFEQRIEETADLLSALPKPALITIARSQGGRYAAARFVPAEKVDDVQRYLIEKLTKIY